MYNVKYVVMAVVLLHNICVYSNDPCRPRRKLNLNEIELIDTDQTEDKTEIVKTKAWRQLAKLLNSCGNKKFDYTVYIYNC